MMSPFFCEILAPFAPPLVHTPAMVYFDPACDTYMFVHEDDETFNVAFRFTAGGHTHAWDEHCFADREAAQQHLDRLAAKLNLIREPGMVGRWI